MTKQQREGNREKWRQNRRPRVEATVPACTGYLRRSARCNIQGNILNDRRGSIVSGNSSRSRGRETTGNYQNHEERTHEPRQT